MSYEQLVIGGVTLVTGIIAYFWLDWDTDNEVEE